MSDTTATAAAPAARPIEVVVKPKGKALVFAEAMTTGSVYAVSVRGGSATCGQTAVLCVQVGDAVVASGSLVNGAGTLSLMTSEMREACRRFRLGMHIPAFAVLRCMDEGAERNVAIGMADVVHAGDAWYDEATSYEMWMRMGYGALRILHCDADDSWHVVRVKKNALGQFIMSVDQDPISFSDATETVVYRVGDQTVEGVKSFESSPLVPTVAAADSSSKAASTAFVHAVADAAGGGSSIYAEEHRWTAEQTYDVPPRVPTVAATTDSSTRAASTAFVQNVVNAEFASLDAGWWSRFKAALLAASNTWTGAQVFTASPAVPVPGAADDSSSATCTSWVRDHVASVVTLLKLAANVWTGRQTFTLVPYVGTAADDSDGTEAASTGWVAAWWTRAKAALLGGANSWGGAQEFSQPPTVPTVQDASDSSGRAASTAFVQRAIAAAGAGEAGAELLTRYAMVTKTLVDNACTLDDRAVNTLSLGAATLATLTVPDAPDDGKSRDFWLVVTIPSTANVAISLSGATFYGETADTFVLEVGSVPNVLVFTEIASGYFVVSRRTHATASSTLAT